MSKNIRTQLGKVIGKSLNSYHARVKPIINDIKFKEQYQGRIIDCMVGEVDDNYIETPETDSAIVKLEHSKEGLVKVPSIKGKTILVDADGNETDTPAEGCRLVSVGEEEDNKLIILSNNKNLLPKISKSTDWNGANITISNHTITFTPNVEKKMGIDSLSDIFYMNIKSGTKLTLTRWYVGGAETFAKGAFNAFVKLVYKDGTEEDIKPYDNTPNNVKSTVTITKKVTKDVVGFKVYAIGYAINGLNTPISYKIQLEINDTSTPFVESNYNKTEILLDEPLRGLPNGVCDEIVGNKLIRRVGKVVLDGVNESWSEHDGEYGEYKRYRWYYHSKMQFAFKSTEVNYMTSVIKCVPNKLWQDQSEHIELDQVAISIMTKKAKGIDDLVQILKDNPIELFYELKEPIIEELPNGITLQGFDDTTMYIENSITPTVSYGYNALIPYKEELLNQKEEVETNTLDIENNIIPYLMDMEFNLMLMEDNE